MQMKAAENGGSCMQTEAEFLPHLKKQQEIEVTICQK